MLWFTVVSIILHILARLINLGKKNNLCSNFTKDHQNLINLGHILLAIIWKKPIRSWSMFTDIFREVILQARRRSSLVHLQIQRSLIILHLYLIVFSAFGCIFSFCRNAAHVLSIVVHFLVHRKLESIELSGPL